MDEENKKINIDSFFNRIEEVDQVAGKALKKSNLNANAIEANKTLIDSLSLTIETMKTEIRDIANYIIIERKLEKDAEEDRKLELEDAEQKKSMTDRALALVQPTSEKNSIAPQSGSEGGGGGGFLSGLLGAIATGGLIALATPLVPVIAPLLLKAMAVGISAIAGGLLIKKLAEITPKILKKVNDGLKAGFEKTKELYKNLEGKVKDSLKKVGDSLKSGFKKTQELYKNLEGKFLKLAGDVGGFLKKKGKQSINLLKRTTGGVADFLTGGVFDFDKKGEGITDNVLMGNKLAAKGFKGVIDNMNIVSSAKAGTLDEFIAGGGVLPENEPKIELSGASKELIGDDKPFLKAIEDLSEKRGINQSELLGLIASESSFDPKAVNKDTGATGLIQFMPEVAESLGTTTDEIREMSRAEQVKLIDKYFDMNKLPDNPTAGQLKTNVLMPAYTDKSDDFELMTKNKQFTDGEAGNPNTYFQNQGLDSNKDGFITIGEAGGSVTKKMKEFGIKDLSIEPIKKNNLELSLSQNLETVDKLVNAASYQSGIENKDQNGSVLVQNKPAQVTIASIKKTSSPVAFIKSNKNKFLSINESELPPEVARMLT
tara:strand:+ start:1801 stop:3600 length:1800 start_codon:yes stop_codon:yes gene_type:complete